jgi:hypothetical protein
MFVGRSSTRQARSSGSLRPDGKTANIKVKNVHDDDASILDLIPREKDSGR